MTTPATDLVKPLTEEFWGFQFLSHRRVGGKGDRWAALDQWFVKIDKSLWVEGHPKSEPYVPHPRRREPQCECFGCRGAPGAKHEHPLVYATKDLPILEQALATVLAKEAEVKERRDLKKTIKETSK